MDSLFSSVDLVFRFSWSLGTLVSTFLVWRLLAAHPQRYPNCMGRSVGGKTTRRSCARKRQGQQVLALLQQTSLRWKSLRLAQDTTDGRCPSARWIASFCSSLLHGFHGISADLRRLHSRRSCNCHRHHH